MRPDVSWRTSLVKLFEPKLKAAQRFVTKLLIHYEMILHDTPRALYFS